MKFFLVASFVCAASTANLSLHDQAGAGRIIGGEDALDGELTWMVYLRTIG